MTKRVTRVPGWVSSNNASSRTSCVKSTPRWLAASTSTLTKNNKLVQTRCMSSKTPAHQQQASQVKEVPKSEMRQAPMYMAMDGNEAAAYVAYAMSEISFIYPISPSTSMGEAMDKWSASGKLNVLGQPVDVNMMQSEGGAAGALHGAAAAGTMSSTFTASQGLLLMIPNMYLLAGELMPTVFHVSARTVSKHALSIFNDHSDVMSCRQTGFAMLCSSSVQEVMDLALVSHVASLKSRLPFLHFFDGYRTSAEVSKIKAISYDDMATIFPHEAAESHLHKYALNPNHPTIRGTGQRPDIFFQSTVAANKYYQECPDVVESVMKEVEAITGRPHKLFDYHGSPTAERVVILMGSAAKTVEETVDHMNATGENVGVLTVRLYRPWSAKHFLGSLPDTVKKIAVLDRTREDGSSGSPLFLDVCVTLSDANMQKQVVGGQYGLASKEFTPAMAKAVYDHLNAENPMKRYVVGIEDDVTHTSLPYGAPINTIPKGTSQCIFWGLGTDGTIGANKTAIKTIGLNTDLKAQGHFVYDSHKGDGVTISHLRFGPEVIKSEYAIERDADYISCHHPSYVQKFEMLGPLKEGGIFVLNSPWNSLEEMEKKLPIQLKQDLARKKAELYNIDASSVAQEIGLGKRINMLMQTAFYRLSGVLPVDQAIELLKKDISIQYAHKGPKVIDMNYRAVDAAMQKLQRIEYPASWVNAVDGGALAVDRTKETGVPSFITNIMDPVLALEGDKLPVSSFEPGGYMPTGTTVFEKRGIAPNIPVWIPDKCTQCNYCAIVCPHAVVRPFLLDKGETKAAPVGFESRKAKGGSEVSGYNYTIQISPMDCTGCEVCVESCPDDALYMAPFNDVSEGFKPHWDYASALPLKTDIGDKFTVKGSQFEKPMLEFSGACAGCGETPYVKLATQLFGDKMVIANSSGCSSVWGGTATTIPFATGNDGRGPAWGRSLFEDTAEYGFGMYMATKQRRAKVAVELEKVLQDDTISPELKTAMTEWLKNKDNRELCDTFATKLEGLLEVAPKDNARLRSIYHQRDMLRTQSHWVIGGDGWAYDIGFGGLDHVLAQGEDINLLVLDTEMYSNTGGQVSKATQLSTVTKFATSGKRHAKKDLGQSAMLYENVYVASVALGANMNQTVQAFKEAESYPGTSIIIAYSPCIDWGIEMKSMMDAMKDAVESGYWTLYRYDPRRGDTGLKPFQLDSRKLKADLKHFLDGQNRFHQLVRKSESEAENMHKHLYDSMLHRHKKFREMAMDDFEKLDYLKSVVGEEVTSEKSVVLYGSETGTAEALAGVFTQELLRRGIRARCLPMDDFEFDDLPKQSNVYCIAATCGQGEFPANCKGFWEALNDKDLPSDFLADTKFTVFGLGDSSYVFYNETAKLIDQRFEELGGQRVQAMGLGDDKDEEKYETVWNEWLPELWNELGTPVPPMELLPPTYSVYIDNEGELPSMEERYVPLGTKLVPMTTNKLITPEGYDHEIRHFEFDLAGSGMSYGVGDCLGVYPHNPKERVQQFLDDYQLKSDAMLNFEDLQHRKDPLPRMTTASQLFTQTLDIFGRPGRRFYETLGIATTDEEERKEIEFLLTKEGKDKMRELQKETATYADLLKLFPGSKMSLEYLVDYVPRIKPRLYSIASSQEMHENMLHLCIVKEDWTTPKGEYRHGLSTGYLKGLSLGDKPDFIAGRINAAGITIPDNHRPPIIMVGLGTGLAPFRAFIEDREVARIRGENIGPMALIFGARKKATDYTYGDELEGYHSGGKGVLSELITAFSRDQAHKIYVQNRIQENPQLVYDYLVKEKGYFYLCGPAGNVPPAVRKAVCDAIVKCGDFTDEQADKYVTDMQIEGRYNVEAW